MTLEIVCFIVAAGLFLLFVLTFLPRARNCNRSIPLWSILQTVIESFQLRYVFLILAIGVVALCVVCSPSMRSG